MCIVQIFSKLYWFCVSQIEELASCLSFDSRQSSMESLASLDSRSTLSSRSASNSPVPPKGSPLHSRFRVSAKKALLLWVREQCHRLAKFIGITDQGHICIFSVSAFIINHIGAYVNSVCRYKVVHLPLYCQAKIRS